PHLAEKLGPPVRDPSHLIRRHAQKFEKEVVHGLRSDEATKRRSDEGRTRAFYFPSSLRAFVASSLSSSLRLTEKVRQNRLHRRQRQRDEREIFPKLRPHALLLDQIHQVLRRL